MITKKVSKARRVVKYKRLIESINRNPDTAFYLCVDLGVVTDNLKLPELELFRPEVETPEMVDNGWFGRGCDDLDNNARRVFVLAMMIEMAK